MQKQLQVTHILPLQSYNGGAFQKLPMVGREVNSPYPNDIHFFVLKKLIPAAKVLKVGDIIDVKFNIKSQEFKGKWYTDVYAWSFKPSEMVHDTQGPVPHHDESQVSADTQGVEPEFTEDDVPF